MATLRKPVSYIEKASRPRHRICHLLKGISLAVEIFIEGFSSHDIFLLVRIFMDSIGPESRLLGQFKFLLIRI